MEEKRTSGFRTVAAIAVALPLAYVASYVALSTPKPWNGGLTFALEPPLRTPHYRFGGEYTAQLYRPLHWVDVKLRRRYWYAEPRDTLLELRAK